MAGAKYCAVHSTTSAATNTSTTLDGTFASTCFGVMHDVLRCKFSIHWEMLWLQCFRVVSFSQRNSSGYFNSGGSLFSNECHVMSWWWAIDCECLSGWRNTSIVLVVMMTFYDQTFNLCFWHRLNFVHISPVHSTSQSSLDISRRNITRAAMQNLDNQICKSRIAISTKLKLYNNCILPIFLYGSECWAVTKRDVFKIDALDQWCLRKLLGIKWYHHLRNDAVRRTTGQPRLLAIVQARRLSLFDHIALMTNETDAKKIIAASPSENWRRPQDIMVLHG